MSNLQKLPKWDGAKKCHVVVESPGGSRLKLKYDPELKVFGISRRLVLGVEYPFDWGFIPSTMAADGDPLDAMVLGDEPTYPGILHACEVIGVVRLTQKGEAKGQGREANDRIIAVPVENKRFDDLRDARKLPERTREEIEIFFKTAVLLEHKDVHLLGWDGPEAGLKLIAEAAKAWEGK